MSEKEAPEELVRIEEIIGITLMTEFQHEGKVYPMFVTSGSAETVRAFLASANLSEVPELGARKTKTLLGPAIEIQPIKKNHAIDFSTQIDGRKYRQEITDHEKEQAKKLGLVVVFGHSDDIVCFEGAISDEADRGKIHLSATGKILNEEALEAIESLIADGIITQRPVVHVIEANFTKDGWKFDAKFPRSTFSVWDDEDASILYGEGFVFALADLND